MYELLPLTDRVQNIKSKYRDVKHELCISRYKIVTEFYMNHPELTGIMRRALYFKDLCEKVVIRIEPDEVIVGTNAGKFGAAALYPENGIDWLPDELRTGLISTRGADPYFISDQDRDYILETASFWETAIAEAKGKAYVSEGYFPHADNGFLLMDKFSRCSGPYGHFCSGYHNAIDKGFAAIKAEADEYMHQMEDRGIRGNEVTKYHFYKSVSIVSEAMITLTRRYAKLAEEMYQKETDPNRKKELAMMVDTLNWCMVNPARNFTDAVQTLYMYHNCMCLDANMHGISFGRVDQYLGKYYQQDIADGTITPEYAQEIFDLFYMKVAEMNKPWSAVGTLANPGYTNGMLMTLGGVDKDGNDATNPVTYMMLQSISRLDLHDPPQALRIHRGTPKKLWEAAIETTKKMGGIPTFQSDEAIIPVLQKLRGFSLEDARNYTLIGCVEPGGTGCDWPGMTGPAPAPINLAGAIWLAINNGINPMPAVIASMALKGDNLDDAVDKYDAEQHQAQQGLPTGYLYEMETFEEFLDALEQQILFFLKWQMTNQNLHEFIMQQELPVPVVSATMDDCMKNGADVMFGGARYSGYGVNIVGLGNAADSIQMIKRLCYDENICTTREMYDALINNWEGYEDLHQYIKDKAIHFGNANEEADKWMPWVSGLIADAINAEEGSYCRYTPGVYPVTMNVTFGKFAAATPDGRMKGDPLADGIAPVQATDKTGPTSTLLSVSKMQQDKYGAGTLMNVKFHPNALNGEDGVSKLTNLIETYFFDMGGMELQINVTSADMLRAAQADPEKHKNLVVRVAGFSTYFVELHDECRNDLIKRTEHLI